MGQNVPLDILFEKSSWDSILDEWTDIPHLKSPCTVSKKREPCRRKRRDIDFDDLDATIRWTLQDTGKNIDREARVPCGQFEGIRWKNVDALLKRRANSHPDFKIKSVLEFMELRGIETLPGLKKPRGNAVPPLDLDDTELAIRLTLEKPPFKIKLHETVIFGKSAGSKWYAVDQRLKFYGTTHPGCGFNSIVSFMRARGIKKFSRAERLALQSGFNDAAELVLPSAKENFMLVSGQPEKLISQQPAQDLKPLFV